MPERSRPLSPFLHYRWQYTNTLSILHRLTGITLTGSFLLLVYWLTALASGPTAYERASKVLSNPLFTMVLALGLVAFSYHLCNGIRHLLWDAGLGLERREARRSAWGVVVATIVIVALISGLMVLRFVGAS